MAIRRLFFDIETSPCLGWFWRPSFQMSLGYHNIIEQAKIICICYKWSDNDKVYHLNWDSKQCDKLMLKKFIKILNQADEIVGHNSDKFDIKWIRTRCLFHDIDMMPEYQSLDTLKAVRKGMNFPSNRLDSIGRYLGEGKKIKTTEELWFDVWRKNSKKALKGMVDYCKQDVILLEKIFNKINPYIKNKTGADRDSVIDCPECGSDHTIIRGYRTLVSGNKNVKLQCQKCHKYHHVPLRKYYLEKAKK